MGKNFRDEGGEIGLQPIRFLFFLIPGTVPQATVNLAVAKGWDKSYTRRPWGGLRSMIDPIGTIPVGLMSSWVT